MARTKTTVKKTIAIQHQQPPLSIAVDSQTYKLRRNPDDKSLEDLRALIEKTYYINNPADCPVFSHTQLWNIWWYGLNKKHFRADDKFEVLYGNLVYDQDPVKDSQKLTLQDIHLQEDLLVQQNTSNKKRKIESSNGEEVSENIKRQKVL